MRNGRMFFNMMFIFAGCLALSACSQPDIKSKLKYYGADSRQTLIDFTTTAEIPWTLPVVADDMKNETSDLYKKVMEGIEKHSEFVFAVFTLHTQPTNFTEHPGSVRNGPSFKVLNVTKSDDNKTIKVTYTYHDLAAFQQNLFVNADPLKIEFRLPTNPYTTYAEGLVPIDDALKHYQNSRSAVTEIKKAKAGGAKTFNLCTDVSYNDEDDYWYFWNPDLDGCPQTAHDDVILVEGVLTPMSNTTVTYPEYDRLIVNHSMKIKYLVGIDDTFNKDDLGVQGFAKTFKILTLGKQALQLSSSEITLTDGERKLLAAVPDADDVKFSVIEDRAKRKKIELKTAKYDVIVDMELWDETTDAFDKSAADGMRNYNVFIYDGHSGLGEFLGRDTLFKKDEKLDTNKYQIFFFNGCSTYAYYDLDYLEMKKSPQDPNGTKNLDIITTSIGADFSIGPGSDVMLIRNLAKTTASWQNILDNIYDIDPNVSALIQVNGDEDNPTTLPQL